MELLVAYQGGIGPLKNSDGILTRKVDMLVEIQMNQLMNLYLWWIWSSCHSWIEVYELHFGHEPLQTFKAIQGEQKAGVYTPAFSSLQKLQAASGCSGL